MPAANSVVLQTRAAGRRLLALIASLIVTIAVGFAMPAQAVDLTGMTLRVEGIIEATADRSSADENFTFPLEIYFGSKGTRFVTMLGISGSVRVAIDAGKDRGLKRRKDGKFIYEVKLQQTPSSLQVKILGRGQEVSAANDSWSFEIGLGNGSCRTQKFRYVPDPRVYLEASDHRLLNGLKVVSKQGACSVTKGVPEGLPD